MINLFKRIKYFFLARKEKDLKNKLKNTTKKSYTNKTSKTVYSKAADLTLNSQTQKTIDEVKDSVAAIVKKTNCNPEELLNYIKAAKTPVYKINHADKLLKYIHEEEGFICPKKGWEALYLSLITGQMPSFATDAMFVMREGSIDKFYMLHNFYCWYSLKAGLPGFEPEARKHLKIFLYGNNEALFNSLSMEKIINLKEAVARDQEATEFVLEYTKQIEGAKKVLDKIKDEGGANI